MGEYVIRRVSYFFNQVMEFVTVPIMGFYAILTFVGVLSRFIFKIPIVEAVELSRLGFVWACLLGATVAYKRRGHIRFTAISNLLPLKVSNFLALLMDLLSLIFMGWVLYHGADITIRVWPSRLSATGFSSGIMYLCLPIAMITMIIHCINFIVEDMMTLMGKEAFKND